MVTFDENGYYIDGKPVFLVSGEFQYFRLTAGEWEKRLLQVKMAGLNAVSVYFAWNYHEVKEGEWDFTGDKDIERFLKIAARTGLYVIARPGPFICNEWEGGGIPAWLSAREGIRIRTADARYLEACDQWWDKIAPLIARYQIDREGSIILVQVENEYGHMGEHQEADYIYHLRDGLRSRGVTVPVINCDSFIRFDAIKPRKWEGINLCCNAGGDGLRVLERARGLQKDAPLFVTEFWIAAFDWWGRNGSAAYEDTRALNGALEMIAGGAGGLTLFVFSGGSNFAYWHGQSICSDSNFITTLYGPGAPILTDGRFSGKYYGFKKILTGIGSVSEYLAAAGMPEITGDMEGVVKAVRRCKDTVFTFYINHSKEQMQIADAEKEQAAVDMSIPAGEVRWSVEHLPIGGGLVLENTSASLFSVDPALCLYGPEGVCQEILLSGEGALAESVQKGAGLPGDWERTEGRLLLRGTPSKDGVPVVWRVRAEDTNHTVILLSEKAADTWYRISLPGVPACLIGGVDRMEKVQRKENGLRIEAYAWEERKCYRMDKEGLSEWTVARREREYDETIPLTGWRVCRDFPEAQPDCDDSGWYGAESPQPMAKFGSGNGRAWYRAELDVAEEGFQMLMMSGANDRFLVFADGRFVARRGAFTKNGLNTAIWLTKGRHTLAILAENLGMFNTGGEMSVPLGEPKGIFGDCWLNGQRITGWRMREGIRAGEMYDHWEIQKELAWEEQNDCERSAAGPVWLNAQFPYECGRNGSVRLKLGGAGKGSVWVNGFNIGRYWNVGPQDDIWIPEDKLLSQNQIVIFEEESLAMADTSIEISSYGIPVYGELDMY